MQSNNENPELRLSQCDVGRFNLLSNEKTLEFSLSIFINGKIAKHEDCNATLSYSGDPSDYDLFAEWKGNLEEIYSRCYGYALRVGSSIDYMGQCIAFAHLYQRHFEALDAAMLAKERERIAKEIEALSRELENEGALVNLYSIVAYTHDKTITVRKRWIAECEADLAQLVEGAPKAEELTKKIARYRKEIARLQAACNVEPAQEGATNA